MIGGGGVVFPPSHAKKESDAISVKANAHDFITSFAAKFCF
jgi:hypothetical protein